MATFLFDKIIFGPIRSRRLGISLGVNLLSPDNKLCNFECIYCECGWTGKGKPYFNPLEEVSKRLRNKLEEMAEVGQPLDVITFAGNGEPTMHPQFAEIINSAIALRDRIFPSAKIAVLSNATLIGRSSVHEALLKVDRNILKLDSAFDTTVQRLNGPKGTYSVARTVEFMKTFNGRFILQTMFLRGEYNGELIDNTIETEVVAWLEVVKETRPQQVMIYTIDRDTPAEGLRKVSVPELQQIAQRVEATGISCSVAG